MYRAFVSMMLVAALFFSACGNDSSPQTGEQTESAAITAEFRSQFTGAVKKYLELKDALVAGDQELAVKKGEELKTALSTIDAQSLSEKGRSDWQGHLNELSQSVDRLINRKGIMQQRAEFRSLSNTLIASINAYGPLEMPLYVQHCPMAFDYSGGDWLSDSEKIMNPYYGQMMLNCGSVTKTFAQK